MIVVRSIGDQRFQSITQRSSLHKEVTPLQDRQVLSSRIPVIEEDVQRDSRARGQEMANGTCLNVYCGFRDHWSDMCQEYPDISSRVEQLEGRCKRCLGRNHETSVPFGGKEVCILWTDRRSPQKFVFSPVWR